MNDPSQTVRLLAIVQAATPAMRMTEMTPDVWHELLADVPFEAAQAAVYRHTKTSGAYLAPSDVRRLVAEDAGLLPPSTEEALRLAQKWANDQGEWGPVHGRPTPSTSPTCPSRWEVAALLGSHFIAQSPSGVVHKRFEQAYRSVVERHVAQVLASDLGEPPRPRVGSAPAAAAGREPVSALLVARRPDPLAPAPAPGPACPRAAASPRRRVRAVGPHPPATPAARPDREAPRDARPPYTAARTAHTDGA